MSLLPPPEAGGSVSVTHVVSLGRHIGCVGCPGLVLLPSPPPVELPGGCVGGGVVSQTGLFGRHIGFDGVASMHVMLSRHIGCDTDALAGGITIGCSGVGVMQTWVSSHIG